MSNTVKNDDVLIVGLPSGEHLLGTVSEREGGYYVEDAVVIMADPDPTTGKMRMGLMPYMPYAENGLIVPAAVCTLAQPTEELRNHYCQKFGRIITPSTKIVSA